MEGEFQWWVKVRVRVPSGCSLLETTLWRTLLKELGPDHRAGWLQTAQWWRRCGRLRCKAKKKNVTVHSWFPMKGRAFAQVESRHCLRDATSDSIRRIYLSIYLDLYHATWKAFLSKTTTANKSVENRQEKKGNNVFCLRPPYHYHCYYYYYMLSYPQFRRPRINPSTSAGRRQMPVIVRSFKFRKWPLAKRCLGEWER